MNQPPEVLAFIAAADRLVNLLATTAPSGEAAKKRLERDVDVAYCNYDLARAALVGFPQDEG